MNDNRKMRKQYFLKNSSQLQLIIRVYLILLFVILLAGVVFYFIGNKNLTSEYFQAHSLLKTTMELLLPALIFVNCLGLAGAFWMILLFTHSIAGPIYRLRILSESIKKGDLSIKIKFRKNDQLQELADILNQTLESINLRFESIHHTSNRLKQIINKIENTQQILDNDPNNLKHELKSISHSLEKIQKID